MYSALLALLLLLFFAVAFSIQNSEPIILNFFAWTIQGSRALILLSALALGIGLTLLAALPIYIKKIRLIAKQQKTIATLEQSVAQFTNPPSNT